MLDDSIPTLDHLGVHLFDRAKWSITVFDNVFVSVVKPIATDYATMAIPLKNQVSKIVACQQHFTSPAF
jgi:hypothetical protein